MTYDLCYQCYVAIWYLMYYLTFYLESTRAKIDFYSERLKQLAGTSFPPESNNDDHTKGKFYSPILLSVYFIMFSIRSNKRFLLIKGRGKRKGSREER